VPSPLGSSVRALRRAPAFSAVVVATLALGIGATTAIFTIVDTLLLRPLRFPDAQRLVMMRTTAGSRLSPAFLDEWRRQARTFDDIAGWHDERANLTGSGEPVEVLVDRVTPNFFAMLGTPAALGRTFVEPKDLGTAANEAVLSHGFWQRQFGRDPSVIGRAITLDGRTLTIVGVMPEHFKVRTNELAESRAEIWTPTPLVPGTPAGMGGILNVVGRLAPGVTVEGARAELSLIAQRIERDHPSYSRHWGVIVVPLHSATVQDVRLTALVLFGSVAILLLIGCANVANLMLGRATTRAPELAIRLSLGATRWRLVRELLTESVSLAALGGALGMTVAWWGTRALVAALPAGLDVPRTQEIGVDLRVFAFAALVTLIAAVLFGLVPALISTRPTSQAALRNSARGSSAGRVSTRMTNSFIIAEVALATILLAAAGLIGRSFWELSRVHPGFQPEHVLTLQTTLSSPAYDTEERVRAFGSDVLERVRRLPDVRAAGLVDYLPMSRSGLGRFFRIVGRPEPRLEDQPSSWISLVGGRYFEAMGIPLLRGRLPDARDNENGDRVLVIDETFARRHWQDGNAIGARLVWKTEDGGNQSGEVVGVVGSVRWAGMAADPPATTYSWFPQAPSRTVTLVVRTPGNPGDLARAVAAAVRSVDPNQPVAEVRALQDLVSADLAQPRSTMIVIGSFGASALLLATIGLYGVIALWVSRRQREIGVRLALGAQHRDLLRLVGQRGLVLIGSGLAIGVAAALALGRVLAGLLYGVTPKDPMTLVSAALFLASVAIVAIYFPARRASRIDPLVVLKAD
jgi:putative ABC transport system permease protein